jgi:hexosaminidase
MKKSILFFLLLACTSGLFAQGTPSIIPLPKTFQEKNESFVLDANVTIHFNDPLLADEAHFLQGKIFDDKGFVLPVGKELKEKNIALILKKDNEPQGGYRLTMSSQSIQIESGSEEGLFNGIISLMQLSQFSSSVAIPCWDIEDAPKHDWWGVMLDESRHFFGKREGEIAT